MKGTPTIRGRGVVMEGRGFEGTGKPGNNVFKMILRVRGNCVMP